jgi:hypothetical protein
MQLQSFTVFLGCDCQTVNATSNKGEIQGIYQKFGGVNGKTVNLFKNLDKIRIECRYKLYLYHHFRINNYYYWRLHNDHYRKLNQTTKEGRMQYMVDDW